MTNMEALPKNIDAERYLIGCLIRFPDRADEVFSRLTATDFFDLEHAKIFRAAQKQFAAGGIDPVLLAREVGAAQTLVELGMNPANAPATAVHIPTEVAKIVECRRKRQRYDALQTLASHALNGYSSEAIDIELESLRYDWRRETEATKEPETFTLSDLRRQYANLNQPMVDGLFRVGETVNIIANSKSGKSWLAYGLAWSVIVGEPWLGRFATTPGRVLLIDNELHRNTLAHRIPAVAASLNIDADFYGSDFTVRPMRGRLASLADIASSLEAIEPGTYRLIILDAKYRFIAPGTSENDNASETQFYNLIDHIADHTKAAIILVHHGSKGDQGGKRTTDVGAGAGAQSRAADCHLVLREHEDPEVAVLDAAVRSFPPVEPLALRWQFPLWVPTTGVDPKAIKGRFGRQEEKQRERDREGMEKTIAALREGPATQSVLRNRTGYRKERQENLINLLCAEGKAGFREAKVRGNQTREYYLP